MARRIPASGINLFQLIYIYINEYLEKTGEQPLNLSLGNPDTIPTQALREMQSRYVLDSSYQYHTYAEDKNLLGFAEAMTELHGRIRIEEHGHLKTVPIAGIKTASAYLALACGLHLPNRFSRDQFRVVSNLPAYDIIGTWAENYLGAGRIVWPLRSSEGMRLNLKRLEEILKTAASRIDLIFVIRPGNPASVGANQQEWRDLIELCLKHNSRLVNDAAYAGLSDNTHVPLASVAKDYPELDWMELYSVSKSFSDPGARLGAAVGSKDFMEDFILVKGNTDSGPVPGLMAAYGDFLKSGAAMTALTELRTLYRKRLDYLIPHFKAAGLKPACATEAGFFTLWKVPKRVLGVEIAAYAQENALAAHEAFNRLVISQTGIVGVHFQGFSEDGGAEPLIRYAVCADVLDLTFQRRFEQALERLRPEY